MRPFYIVFTVVEGDTYTICKDSKGDLTVENKPTADNVLKIYDKDKAIEFAGTCSKNTGREYKFKLIE